MKYNVLIYTRKQDLLSWQTFKDSENIAINR